MLLIRFITVAYVMISPFVMIYLQQKVFKESFDDELGSKVIMRLHLITTIACVTFFAMSLDKLALEIFR